MPKVKVCKLKYNGHEYVAQLSVRSDGTFSIARPGEAADWPGYQMTITGTVAATVESEWEAAVIELSNSSKVERKVIIVRFDSSIRKGGKRNFFNRDDLTLLLEATIALETVTTRGTAVKKVYSETPEHGRGGAQRQPFPNMMTLGYSDLNYPANDWCVVEWTQELESAIVRACNGIEAIVDLLDGVLTEPETLKLAAIKLALLPSGREKLQP